MGQRIDSNEDKDSWLWSSGYNFFAWSLAVCRHFKIMFCDVCIDVGAAENTDKSNLSSPHGSHGERKDC